LGELEKMGRCGLFRGIGEINKRKERFLAVVVGEEGKERAMGRGEERR
jgi:hypothetical protein